MEQQTIRRLDALMGKALCYLLTRHRRRAAERVLDGPVRSLVFLKLIEQGATVLAEPAIRQAVARVGRERVYFCVFPENRHILDLLGLIPPENVLELRHDSVLSFAVDALRAVRRLRRVGVDAVIDMEFMARAPAILAYLIGAPVRVGLHRFTAEAPYRGDLMTHRVQYSPYLHTSLAYLLLVEALDHDPTDLPLLKVPADRASLEPPRFVATAAEREAVRALVDAEAGRGTERLVLLNPNTGDLLPRRLWPTERMVELGRRLLEHDPALTLVLTGAPSERDGALEVRARVLRGREREGHRVVCVAGRTTLRQVFVLYTLGEVLVTNDSGPGHFASMTDIHDVVLFGPETPALFGPLGSRARVITAGLACSPCVSPYNHRSSPCTDNLCMQAITVDEVFEVVATALAERQEERA